MPGTKAHTAIVDFFREKDKCLENTARTAIEDNSMQLLTVLILSRASEYKSGTANKKNLLADAVRYERAEVQVRVLLL